MKHLHIKMTLKIPREDRKESLDGGEKQKCPSSPEEVTFPYFFSWLIKSGRESRPRSMGQKTCPARLRVAEEGQPSRSLFWGHRRRVCAALGIQHISGRRHVFRA